MENMLSPRNGIFVLSLACVLPAQASLITLGYASFTLDNPVTGQSSVTINNFSGQTFGCAPDFPICDNVSIATGTLLISYLDAFSVAKSLTRTLQFPILAGTTTPANFIFDSTAVTVTTAFLSGTIAPLSFSLADNSTVTVSQSFGVSLDIGNSNIGLIQLNPVDATATPEPGSFLLLLGPAALLARRRS